MSEKLKPCPFCGRADKLSVQDAYIHFDGDPVCYRVTCYECHPHAYRDSPKEAVEAWNKRVTE